MGKLIAAALVLLSSFAFANTGGLAGAPPSEAEVTGAYAILVQQRFERGDNAGAAALVQRCFSDQPQVGERVRLIQMVTQDSSWSRADGNARAEILKIALKDGPPTARYERELLYLLARTQSLEGMGTLLAYATTAGLRLRPKMQPNSDVAQLIPDWKRSVISLLPSGRILVGEMPATPYEILGPVARWLTRIKHPDHLIALVDKNTSALALQSLRAMISLRPEWHNQVGVIQANRLRFWERSKGCEESLGGELKR